MGLRGLALALDRYRRAVSLIALLSTFAGVALLIDRPKGVVLEWLAVPLIALGGSIFTGILWPKDRVATRSSPSLATRVLRRITGDGRFVRIFPAVGVGLILADLTFNLGLSASPSIQTEDTIVILGAVAFVAYDFAPNSFARERDFVLIFFLCLNLVLVAPLLVARLYFADFAHSVDVYSWTALAPQTGAVLSVVGVKNSVHAIAGSTAPALTFTPQHLTQPVTLVITTACSGIYSFGIFASAFVSFILTEYEALNRRVWTLLSAGMLAAYVANVLRMVVIVLVGYYTDSPQTDLQNMLLAHSYAGWIIFLGWIALFWFGVFTLVPPDPTLRESDVRRKDNGHAKSPCDICGQPLTPIIPAIKCRCGAFYHRKCMTEVDACPSCSESWAPVDPEDRRSIVTR